MKFLPLLRKALFFSVFIFAFIFIIISCENNPTQPQAGTTSVAGTIVDANDNGVPLAQVQVTSNTVTKTGKILEEKLIAADTADEDGNFIVSSLPADLSNLSFKVHHPDYSDFSTNLNELVTNKDRKKIPVKLLNDTGCKGRIEVTVRSKKDSSLMSEVEVRLNRTGTIIRKGKTNSEGKIVFENVCNGKYWLRLAKSTFKVIETDDGLTIEGQNSIVKTLFMEPLQTDSCCNGVLTFAIKDSATGQLLNGVIVKLYKNGTLVSTKQTENSQAEFTKLCEGTYKVILWKQGFVQQEFNIELGCNESKRIERTFIEDPCCDGKVFLSLKDTSGAPLPALNVALYKMGVLLGTVKTGGDGTYLFTGMCEGEYKILCKQEGLKPLEFVFNINCNDSIYFPKVMSPVEKDTCCNGIIKVAVKDASTKEALNGTTVKMWFNGTYLKSAVVEGGIATFTGLCAGKYGFDLLKDTYTHQEFTVELACNKIVEVEKFLISETAKDTCCKGKIKIWVRNSQNNELLNGATVKIYKNGTLLGSQTVANGYVLFQELCTGKYSFLIKKDGYNAMEFAYELTCNETKEFEKGLVLATPSDSCCKGYIKVIARDSKTKAALNGATVKLWKNGTLVQTGTIASDYCLFKPLCQGTYGIDILKEKYKAIEFQVELGCSEAKAVEKTLDSEVADSCCNGSYTLTVKDSATGNIVKEATVNLWKGSTKISSVGTNADGKVSFTGLCNGDYSISVSRTGYKGREWAFKLGCSETMTDTRKILATQDTCCTAILKVKVIDDSTEAAIYNARVVVYKGDKAISDPRTNAEGWAVIQNLCGQTTYKVLVTIDGYLPADASVVYTDCVTKAITIRLKK